MSIPSAEKVGAVVPAAGQGDRLPGPVAKQFRLLAGVPLLHHVLFRIAEERTIGHIVVVLPPAELDSFDLPEDLRLPVRAVAGGARRQDSVSHGMGALPEEVEWVVVHDGARPLLPVGLVASCLEGAQETGACIAALPVTDTVKRAAPAKGSTGESTVAETLPRGELWQAQTPQVARRDLLEQANQAAEAEGREGTDEASLLEAIGVQVRLTPGDKMNLKVTTPEDLALAEAFLARASAEGAV